METIQVCSLAPFTLPLLHPSTSASWPKAEESLPGDVHVTSDSEKTFEYVIKSIQYSLASSTVQFDSIRQFLEREPPRAVGRPTCRIIVAHA